MKQATVDRIVKSWDLHDDGDISTERLLAMVCDDCNVDVDVVCRAMVKAGRFEEKK